MNFEELIPVIMERFTAFQTLWSLYITVVIGLLAYVAATAPTSSSPFVRLLLIIGFSGFSYVNLGALTAVSGQRIELILLAKQHLDSMPEATREAWRLILDIGSPTPVEELRRFHFFIDFLVIIIILFTTGYTTPKENEQIFSFPNIQTNRFNNSQMNCFLKVRLKGGTSESRIPLLSQHFTTITVVLNDLVSHPVNTKLPVLAQALGHAIAHHEEIAAVSVMLEMLSGTSITERAVYTEGTIKPLEKL